jgi:hypothetical protein
LARGLAVTNRIGLKQGRLAGLCLAFFAIAGHGGPDHALAQSAEFEAVIEVLKERATAAQKPEQQLGAAANELRQQKLVFSTTLVPNPALLLRLRALFSAYFDVEVDLTPLLAKMVQESAVVTLPQLGQLLYNPAHMLILHLPTDWERGKDIRVATLEDLQKTLKHDRPANPLIAAYGMGFEEFSLLANLMQDAAANETLSVVWASSPHSDNEKEAMRYLLLRPLQQAGEIKDESSSCRGLVQQLVEDVRAGKRPAVPARQGLTNIVKPTRFVGNDKEIFLVLSETLLARYYVLVQLEKKDQSCSVVFERPIFAM